MYASGGQVQDGSISYLTSVSGTNAVTAVAALGMSAYAVGQRFSFLAAGTNTGATTLNINSIGAKPVTKNGTNALTGGEITSGAVVEVLYDGTEFQITSQLIPAGVIVMWSGSIVSIPSGWYLCDGNNSTPDLRNRFIVGAGSTYSVAATGGSADAIVVSHTHSATVTDPGHVHGQTGQTLYPSGSGGVSAGSASQTGNANTSSATTGISVGISTTGSSGTNANLPPYYALAYIMKA
jgi:hypothetical protein